MRNQLSDIRDRRHPEHLARIEEHAVVPLSDCDETIEQLVASGLLVWPFRDHDNTVFGVVD
jgi:hypothetical protein